MTFSPRGGGWWWRGWAAPNIAALVAGRQVEMRTCLQQLPWLVRTVGAEQVHGTSIAAIEQCAATELSVPGCDALTTSQTGVALLIRSADCLPLLFADPMRAVIGIAHAGWRGLAAQLPAKMLAWLRQIYHCDPQDVRVAVGPAIRKCCYVVGPEFASVFGACVREERGRRTCDLVGIAVQQLQRAGVAARHIFDTQHCTACEPQHWYSLRKEGPSTGRLISCIALAP